jgi:predicted RNA-binding Zn-ribbon protein involved in translation (DUF1610 family)
MKWNEWRDRCGLQGLERGPLRNMLSDWDSDRSEQRREIKRLRQVNADLVTALVKDRCPDCHYSIEEYQCRDCDGSGDDLDDDEAIAKCPECNGDGNWSQCNKCNWKGLEYVS